MRAVLGIDAAWTVAQPSGVALLVEGRRRWRCAGVAPSYAAFLGLAAGEPVDWERRAGPGSSPPVAALLAAARALAPGCDVAVAAVDMPLAARAIEARRPCDDALSRRFAWYGLGVHSPSPERPGRVSVALRRGFARAGFRLATTRKLDGARHLLEVYPHTALLALLDLDYRLPYKLARARRYWPAASRDERRARLLAAWSRILRALRRKLAGAALALPPAAAPTSRLKRFEDALDALLCAWTGVEFLAGRAAALGDATAAIWSPELPEVAPVLRRASPSPSRPRT